jgi:glucosamine--fructose-6-phosphate aminotransferase (isomerizing)
LAKAEKEIEEEIMCGIVGAIAQRNVVPILLEGLKRLEYRGYDSAGIAILNKNHQLERIRIKGKVGRLVKALENKPSAGFIGIAHTRWATHGEPCEKNAHPHMSNDRVALVHNGIIENHSMLRENLLKEGYKFTSETDTEVIVHLIDKYLTETNDFLEATQQAVKKLTGAFALGIVVSDQPKHIIAVRYGSPLVIGLGVNECFIASDPLALLPVTQQFIYLEEGDIADVTSNDVTIYSSDNKIVKRQIHNYKLSQNVVSRGNYKHYMQKEIFEQPEAISNTLKHYLNNGEILQNVIPVKTGIQKKSIKEMDSRLRGNDVGGVDSRLRGNDLKEIDFRFGGNDGKRLLFEQIKRVQIVACGTSYHAGLIARYWLEEIANIPCQVEVASEIRYRKTIVEPDTLFIAISQSGETADTLAALRQAKRVGYKATLAICNVPESSIVRESDYTLLTYAGPEIGVASTKAFTTQLTVLLILNIILGRQNKCFLVSKNQANLIQQLTKLPKLIEKILALDSTINSLAEQFAEKRNVFFLGRGMHYPVAMEGALKLKEISYIHAESYPAGELKHGPLALIDKDMPVVVIAPNDELLEKLISNIQEVKARGGKLYVFADNSIKISNEENICVLRMPKVEKEIAPIVHTVPLQLLAYHVAVLKGTDIDQPRNLAKSVTVE